MYAIRSYYDTDLNFLKMIMGSGEGDSEIIPIVADSFEDNNTKVYPETLPVLPLRNTVLFPGVVIPLTIGRSKSFRLIKDIQNSTRYFGAVSQKAADVEDPKPEDMRNNFV